MQISVVFVLLIIFISLFLVRRQTRL